MANEQEQQPGPYNAIGCQLSQTLQRLQCCYVLRCMAYTQQKMAAKLHSPRLGQPELRQDAPMHDTVHNQQLLHQKQCAS